MAECYHINPNGSVETAPSWVKCPFTNSCCVGGDECLDDHICRFTHAVTSPGSFSGYYLSNCIDPTFTDPDCLKTCQAEAHPDVVYNYTSQDWACCGSDDAGDAACNSPTGTTFQAPAPAKLSTLTASLVGPTSASSTPAPAQTTRAVHSSSGLSSGAEAGIGVGVALGVCAVVGLALIWFRRRKPQPEAYDPKEFVMQEQPQYSNDADVNEMGSYSTAMRSDKGKQDYRDLAEMDGVSRVEASVGR